MINEFDKCTLTAEEANKIAISNFYLRGDELIEKFYRVIKEKAEKGRYEYELVVPISLREVGVVIESLMKNGYELILGPYSETMMTMKISWKNKRDFSDYNEVKNCVCKRMENVDNITN